MVIYQVTKPFTLDPGMGRKAAPGEQVSFAYGDLIKTDTMVHSKSGSLTGIPVLCTDGKRYYSYTNTSNLMVMKICSSGYEGESEQCLNPEAPTIDKTGAVENNALYWAKTHKAQIGFGLLGLAAVVGIVIYVKSK